jgi:uncharacterized protein (TIGR03067 family)
MRVATMLVLAGVVLVATGRPARGEPGGTGKLTGAWQLICTEDEKRVSPGSGDCQMLIAADGQVTFKVGERITNQGTLRARCAGKARHIDLKLATGKVLGVWEWKGDELIICCDEPGKPRPAGMKPRGTQWVERWQRAKPKPAPCAPLPARKLEAA